MLKKKLVFVPLAAITLLVTLGASGCSTSPPSAPTAASSWRGPVVQAAMDEEDIISPEEAERIAPLTEEEAQYEANQNLTPDTVQERQLEIDATYDVGDALSAEDAEFIRITASMTPQMQEAISEYEEEPVAVAAGLVSWGRQADSVHAVPAATSNFKKSGSGAGGTGTVSGSHTMNYSDAPWNIHGSWSVKYTASGSSAVNKITAKEHVRMYGLVGSSGLGVVYSADPSGTVSGRVNNFSRSASFTAYGTYWTMSYDATFYTSKGSFNVTGG